VRLASSVNIEFGRQEVGLGCWNAVGTSRLSFNQATPTRAVPHWHQCLDILLQAMI
jgi:hypothetical protein